MISYKPRAWQQTAFKSLFIIFIWPGYQQANSGSQMLSRIYLPDQNILNYLSEHERCSPNTSALQKVANLPY